MAIGIMLEDVTQWTWFDLLTTHKDVKTQEPGTRRGRAYSRNGTWKTMAIGYLWVVTWLSVVVPRLIYPVLSRNWGEEKDEVVPFSVIGYFKGP